MPTLLSNELPEPDCPPLRVRLLGEDLVAFRDTAGRVGLLGNHCPHRGASLFFGRNEQGGLRCVYHGWKYDVTGRCVDMPNEPAGRWTHSGGRDSGDSAGLEAQAAGLASQPRRRRQDRPAQWQRLLAARERIRHTAYPCRERSGLIWAYMGPLDPPPDLPELEWNTVPADQQYISRRWQHCNWAQAMEGGIDSSHISFLHRRLADYRAEPGSERSVFFRSRDTHPRFEILDTDYGSVIAARRDADEDTYYWRISQFLLPFYTMIPPQGSDSPSRGGHAWVPIDDEHTMTWTVTWHPTSSLSQAQLASTRAGLTTHTGVDQYLPPTSEPGGRWRPRLTRENDYARDYEAQRSELFFGVRGIWAQDQAVQESMGPLYDRSQEHLGSSDTAVVRVRRMLMAAARALQDRGETPPGVFQAQAYRVRAASVVLPRGQPWEEAAREYLTAVAGVNQPAA